MPYFKRRSFFVDYSAYFDQTAGQPALDLYEYLRDHTDYDVDMIWDAILPSYNIDDIRKAMHLDYVLPSQAINPQTHDRPRSAFIYHVYFMDLLEDTCHYIASLPEETDLYITSTEDKIPQIREYMQQHGISHQATFIPVINRGRDVSALLVAACPVVLSGNMTSLVSLMIRNPVRIRKMDIMAPRAKDSRTSLWRIRLAVRHMSRTF